MTDSLRHFADQVRNLTPRATSVCSSTTTFDQWLSSRRDVVDRAIRTASGDAAIADAATGDAATEEFGRELARRSPGLLVADLPGLCRDCVEQWLGPRLFWLPDPQSAARRRLSIVSSRLGEQLYSQDLRIEGLRTGVLRAMPEAECLLVVANTSCDAFVRRAARLFGVFAVEVVIADAAESLDDWWQSRIGSSSEDRTTDVIHVSPPLGAPHKTDGRVAARPQGREAPLRDRVLFVMSQRITVLHARNNGHIQRLSEWHLSDPHRKSTPILVLTSEDPATTQEAVSSDFDRDSARQLSQRGAVAWRLSHGDVTRPDGLGERSDQPDSVEGDATAVPQMPLSKSSTLGDGPLKRPELWLSHWTRAIHGAWPDEDVDAFLDHLLLGNVSRPRTQLLSLLRILRCQTVYGSSRLVKGDQPVVSFTQRPLSEFRALRVWRRHLRRYDFETRGICVRRAVLEQIGAVRVVYGDTDQVSGAETGALMHPRGEGDAWVAEQEWRLPGNLDLTALQTQDVRVFTDSPEEAAMVGCFGNFEVLVVPPKHDNEAGREFKASPDEQPPE